MLQYCQPARPLTDRHDIDLSYVLYVRSCNDRGDFQRLFMAPGARRMAAAKDRPEVRHSPSIVCMCQVYSKRGGLWINQNAHETQISHLRLPI